MDCDLRVDNSKVSGEHATLRWLNHAWEIKDLGSRNGTFVGNRRLSPGERAHIEAGATFSLGDGVVEFEMLDASPPGAAAFHLQSGSWHVAEGGLLALPSDERPLATIFINADKEWVIECTDGLRIATNREVLQVEGETFTLELPGIDMETIDTGERSSQLGDIKLSLAVTPDEEQVVATVLVKGRVLRLPQRRYHYLLVTLARAWIADAGAAESMRGWIDRDDLCKKLQMDVMKLNVEIHRARKQFAELGIDGAAGLIERRFGTYEIRLGVPNVEVTRM